MYDITRKVPPGQVRGGTTTGRFGVEWQGAGEVLPVVFDGRRTGRLGNDDEGLVCEILVVESEDGFGGEAAAMRDWRWLGDEVRLVRDSSSKERVGCLRRFLGRKLVADLLLELLDSLNDLPLQFGPRAGSAPDAKSQRARSSFSNRSRSSESSLALFTPFGRAFALRWATLGTPLDAFPVEEPPNRVPRLRGQGPRIVRLHPIHSCKSLILSGRSAIHNGRRRRGSGLCPEGRVSGTPRCGFRGRSGNWQCGRDCRAPACRT